MFRSVSLERVQRVERRSGERNDALAPAPPPGRMALLRDQAVQSVVEQVVRPQQALERVRAQGVAEYLARQFRIPVLPQQRAGRFR